VTRFRTRSGETLETLYSADIIELEGEECLLAVSQAVPDSASLTAALLAKATIVMPSATTKVVVRS
jgi:hypothetical protein